MRARVDRGRSSGTWLPGIRVTSNRLIPSFPRRNQSDHLRLALHRGLVSRAEQPGTARHPVPARPGGHRPRRPGLRRRGPRRARRPCRLRRGHLARHGAGGAHRRHPAVQHAPRGQHREDRHPHRREERIGPWFTLAGQSGLTRQANAYLKAAEEFGWEELLEPSDPGSAVRSLVRREPIGVVAAVISTVNRASRTPGSSRRAGTERSGGPSTSSTRPSPCDGCGGRCGAIARVRVPVVSGRRPSSMHLSAIGSTIGNSSLHDRRRHRYRPIR